MPTKIEWKVRRKIFNTYKLPNHDSNKFISLLQKGVYAYENIDDLEKFNETSWPRKYDFYSHLNIENITDEDYAHVKRVCKEFEIKHLGEYHNIYIQSDTSTK